MRNLTVNGWIVGDAQTKISKSGNKYLTFSIGNSEFGDAKDEQGRTIATWFNVTSFLPQHMNMVEYLKKGKPVTVCGEYSNNLYVNQRNGAPSINNNIVASNIWFQLGREDGAQQPQKQTQQSSATVNVQKTVEQIPQVASAKFAQPQGATASIDTHVEDDDLPF